MLALVIVATACGARVTDDQRAAAVGTAGGSQSGSGSGSSSEGATSATEPGNAGGSGSPTGNDTAGTGSGAATATTLPSGGNGGATDVGVTADTINLGLVTTLSGPVPGLFQGATVGAQAFAAYINSQGGVFGRKLKVTVRDDQFDTGQNRALTHELVGSVLGFFGSFSLYDDADIAELQSAGVPDVGYGLTDGRRSSPINFSPQPASTATRPPRKVRRSTPWPRRSRLDGTSPTHAATSRPRPTSPPTSCGCVSPA
jgi:hypothetical protein